MICPRFKWVFACTDTSKANYVVVRKNNFRRNFLTAPFKGQVNSCAAGRPNASFSFAWDATQQLQFSRTSSTIFILIQWASTNFVEPWYKDSLLAPPLHLPLNSLGNFKCARLEITFFSMALSPRTKISVTWFGLCSWLVCLVPPQLVDVNLACQDTNSVQSFWRFFKLKRDCWQLVQVSFSHYLTPKM